MSKFKFDWSSVTNKIMEENNKKPFEKDNRFWKPTTDEYGKATAIIRFLPDLDGTPYVKFYTHNFSYMINGIKKYWIRNCINTFGYDKECPICKKNQEYWNSAFEQDKAIASQRKRKLVFMSNILVIKNPNKPEDEGKVFLYQYGQKIFDKIKDKWFPSEEVKALGDYEEYIPFDLYEGADFKLVVAKQGDYPNYDKSEFGKQKPIGTDEQIEAIMNKTYKLSEFMDPSKFPTNEETIEKLGAVLGISSNVFEKQHKENDDIDESFDIDSFENDISDNEIEKSTSDDDLDEDMEFFNSLR